MHHFFRPAKVSCPSRAFLTTLVFSTAVFCPLASFHAPAIAQDPSAIESVKFNGRDAYRLTDGKIEAVVVPSLGRMMKFGLVGRNLLWNAPLAGNNLGGWQNWGGDKNWFAPQSRWPEFFRGGWPPPVEWDSTPVAATVLPNGVLRTQTVVPPRLGIRMIREYSIANSELQVRQTAEKVSGTPVQMSVWNIAQVPPPDAVFLPTNPRSPYKNNYFDYSATNKIPATTISPTLLQIKPAVQGAKKGYKVGVDSPVSSIAAVWGTTALLLRSARPSGNYPDGADGAGFPVEFYDGDSAERHLHYVELELLSPLRLFTKGSKWTHSIRYSLHELPAADVDSSEVHTAVQQLLERPFTSTQ